MILTVYDNRYVLYQMRNHSTVFPLHLCEEYEYVFQEDIPYIIDLSLFEDQPWYMRLVLEGEDRLEYNQDSKAESWNVSYSAYAGDWSAICEEDPYIEKLIEMEAERERLEALLSKLTENQAMDTRDYQMNGVFGNWIATEVFGNKILANKNLESTSFFWIV